MKSAEFLAVYALHILLFFTIFQLKILQLYVGRFFSGKTIDSFRYFVYNKIEYYVDCLMV